MVDDDAPGWCEAGFKAVNRLSEMLGGFLRAVRRLRGPIQDDAHYDAKRWTERQN
ncbi:hypothetical protein [Kerstersia gyiorum]|uniref:hypothetical protein n=1 Tax=Kerstersia gyiorum TaxID=206506 RepID=UPI00187BCF39|nr:hypothetical protein [Kerstersia gyiorum]